MDRLNFNHFFYFYIVAKEGSIKAAAEKLHISQPTISDQLKLLEDYFRVRLFDRRNRGLFLTSEGELTLKYAERIFGQAAELTSRLRHGGEMPKRSLDIGITQHMSQYFIYDNILHLLEQADLAVKIHEGSRHYLLADLEAGKLDMVFTDDRESIPTSLVSERYGINKTFAVAHRKYQKLKEDFPRCLGEIPFFNYSSDSYLKFEIELFFQRNFITVKTIGEADDVDVLQLVTEKGLAFTVVPEVAMKRFRRNSNVIILGELSELETTVWKITKS